MRAALIQIFPRGVPSPGIAEQICQLTGGDTVVISRSHVIGACTRRIFILRLCDHQVCPQRFQYMLVRSCGMWIPYRYFLSFCNCAHTVRDDPIRSKITAADHIARSRRGHRHTGFF